MAIFYRIEAHLGLVLGTMVATALGPAACTTNMPGTLHAVAAAEATSRTKGDGPIGSPEPDWPQWRGPRRDGICDEKGLLPTWPKSGPKLLWKLGGLGRGWSSPIVVKDRLYVTGDLGSDLVIFAVDLDGKPIWRATNGRSWTGPYDGARACCVYCAGKLYHLNAHGRVACLDARTGRELWAVNMLERFGAENITWGISECLLVDGPRVIVTPGGRKALMAALDKETGQTIWTTEPLADDRASHAAPLLFRHAGRRIIANCSAAHGFGVDADTGKLLWTVPLASPYGVNVTTPIYSAGKIFYVTAYLGGTCYELRPDGSGFRPDKVWDTTLDSCTGAVLLVGNELFGSGYQRHKSWLWVNWNAGQTRSELKAVTTSSAVYADGQLYCLAEDGTAALLRPAAGRLTVEGRFRLVAAKRPDAWACPVVLHGRLYLRYHDDLWCYDVAAKSR